VQSIPSNLQAALAAGGGGVHKNTQEAYEAAATYITRYSRQAGGVYRHVFGWHCSSPRGAGVVFCGAEVYPEQVAGAAGR